MNAVEVMRTDGEMQRSPVVNGVQNGHASHKSKVFCAKNR